MSGTVRFRAMFPLHLAVVLHNSALTRTQRQAAGMSESSDPTVFLDSKKLSPPMLGNYHRAGFLAQNGRERY